MQVVGMSSGQLIPQRLQATSHKQGIPARSSLSRPKTASTLSPTAPGISHQNKDLKVEGQSNYPNLESSSFIVSAQGNISASDFDDDISMASRSSFLDESCASMPSPIKQHAVATPGPS